MDYRRASLPGDWGDPFGPGSRASHRAPAEPGLGPFGLRSLSQAPCQPRAASSAAWFRARRRVAVNMSTPFQKSPRSGIRTRPRPPRRPSRGRRVAAVRGRARQGPVTGLCRPAWRSRGAADRRPRRAPAETPCPGRGSPPTGRVAPAAARPVSLSPAPNPGTVIHGPRPVRPALARSAIGFAGEPSGTATALVGRRRDPSRQRRVSRDRRRTCGPRRGRTRSPGLEGAHGRPTVAPRFEQVLCGVPRSQDVCRQRLECATPHKCSRPQIN